MARSGKPFRFLDYYGIEDAALFFGREKETRILVADILVSRLVVLFARTGTGKTSLINAGVRAELEKQGYATFFVRVHEDPISSAAEEIFSRPEFAEPEGVRFCEQLESVAKRINRPIVVFFDQFEEFFIYVYNENRNKGREFISNIGSLYHNDQSRVHIVFSMREEFFVEMDAFRDEIPTVFHNECNLRLRGFDKGQARDAIVYPLRAFDTWIEGELVDRLIDDLSQTSDFRTEGYEIEPAQLQIVCDTLWAKKQSSSISLDDYLELGQPNRGNVAQQLLLHRFLEGFEEISSREELDLLEKLLPLLRTPQGTKYVRQVRTLAELLKTDESVVRGLLEKLSQAHFIRIIQRAGLEVVELAHDYLVAHLEELRSCARTVVPRRILRGAFSRFQLTGWFTGEEELQAIAPVVGEITIDREVADFLFRSAFLTGHLVTAFFNVALDQGVPVWSLLREQIFAFGPKEAAQAFNVLSDVILEDRPKIPDSALEEIAQLMNEALERDEQTLIAQAFLAKVANARAGSTREKARQHLLEFLSRSPESRPIAWETLTALGSIETSDSLTFIKRALPRDVAQDALVSLTSAENPEIALEAKRLAIRFVHDALAQNELPLSAMRALGEVESIESVNLLRQALSRSELKTTGIAILRNRLCNSAIPKVATAARQVLADNIRAAPVEILTDNPIEKREMLAPTDEPPAATDLAYSDQIANAVSKGRCILFLGAGAHYWPASFSQDNNGRANRPPYGRELAKILADESGFLSEFPDDDSHDLSRVAAWYEFKFSRRRLVDRIRSAFAKASPSPILQALAALPFSLVVTSCFDRLFEQALLAAGRAPMVNIYQPRSSSPPEDPEDDPTPERPLICKIYGDIEVPESVVITDDDFIEHALRMGEGSPFDPLPQTFAYRLHRWESLCLGWTFRSFNLRFLWRALTRRIDSALRPPTYVIDPSPNRLLQEQSQARRDLIFIRRDTWRFVSELRDRINAR